MAEPVVLQNVLDKLDQVKRSGNGYSALCPAHNDSEASMSVKLGDNGAVILNCHRGCSKSDIIDQLGLKMQDLWPADQQKEPTQKVKKKFVESYDYHDIHGTVIFQVVKFADPDGKKSFGQRVPLGEGQYNWTTAGIDKPIYKLPWIRAAIEKGDTIYVAEGEKDVHTLQQLGLIATCNPGGANSWMHRHTTDLTGATKVVIIADNDTAGYKHATTIRNGLETLNIPTQLLAPPLAHNDVTDLIEAGGTLKDLIKPEMPDEQDEYQQILNQLATYTTKDWDLATKLAKAETLISTHGLIVVDNGRLVKWEDFLKEPVEEYDWIIPGLLERQERVIVVAAEGVGKTMLARQVALAAAHGTHPFTRARMPKIRTLFVDLENPERIIRRTSNQILTNLQSIRPTHNIEAHLYIKPDGINILNPNDQQLLNNLIEQTQPDLICMGPLYKTFLDPGGRTSESVTTEAARYLDTIRVTYNCALWLEHHAPFGGSDTTRQLRPFGSTVWSRWPEFGISLRQDETIPLKYNLSHFRGAREERDWPTALQRDTILPFAAIWP